MNVVYPVAFIDPPELLNTTVTNIPGSGSNPLQVVADLGIKVAYAIQFQDTTGDAIGVYAGPVGEEVLKTIIGNGVTTSVNVVLANHSRISLRSMTATPITNGNITIVFLGYGGPPV